MKKTLFLLLLVFCIASVSAQGEQLSYLQTFKPVERVHDFGTIYEKNGKVTNVFKFKNLGKIPIAITEVNTWCGCVVANYTKKAVRPGEIATVIVTFDPNHKFGDFVKQVVLLLNDGKNYVRVWIKADVVPYQHPVKEECPYYCGYGLYMSQKVLPFPNLNEGQSYSFDLELANNTHKRMNIYFRRYPNNKVLRMPEKMVLRSKERKIIKVSYHYYRKYKFAAYINVIPYINGKKAKILKVKWNGCEQFHVW